MGIVTDTILFGLIHDFFKMYLPSQRQCSPHTLRAYQTAMETFLDFTTSQRGISLSEVSFEMLDRHMLTLFLDDIEARGCGVATRNHRLNCIRAFFTYVAHVNPITVIHKADIFKVPLKKRSESDVVEYLSERAIKALLEQPSPLTKKGLRDRFMILFMYDTATRVQGLLDVCLCDIRLGKTPTAALHGKGGKLYSVPLMKQTVEHFQNYCVAFHPDEDEYSRRPLFYTLRNGVEKPLDSSTVRKLIVSCGEQARECCSELPEHIYPHMLRHSRAMHLYQHGMDLTLVSQWLNHARLETTLIYAYADTEQKRKAIEAATPNSSPLKTKLNTNRFTVTDDDTLKKLYGLI